MSKEFGLPINLVKSARWSYRGVEDQIYSAISPYLIQGRWRESRYPLPGHLSMSLGIGHLANVLMSHGVADKLYLLERDAAGRRLLNRFGDVLVPGPWLKKRLANHRDIDLAPDRIHVVGWPRLDLLLRHHSALSERGFPERKLRVLWAPTHDSRRRGPEQTSTSSYPAFKSSLAKLRQICELDISLHPRNRIFKTPTADQLLKADVVISDFGTMVYEAWALGKPVIFPRWILLDRIQAYLPKSAEAYIFEHRIGLHADSLEEMIEMISERAQIDNGVIEFLEEYLPLATRGASGQLAAQALMHIANRGI